MALKKDVGGVADDAREIATLFGNALEQLSKLVQNELQLAKAELGQKVSLAGWGIAYLMGAAILAIPVLVLLLITIAIWLQSLGTSAITAHLLATALGALISLALGLLGKSYFTSEQLKPNVTLQQIQRDMQAVKGLTK